MLTGPSNPPDPRYNAFRKDLADVALVDRIIASHYAQAVEREIAAPAVLRCAPNEGGDPISELEVGERFDLLDDGLGWAWGYAGEARRVGYVRSQDLA